MLVFIIESIILCILFTLLIWGFSSKDPIDDIHNYPPKIIKRCRELNLINDEQLPMSKKTLCKKLIACFLSILIFSITIKFINHINNFTSGFLISYGLWLVVDWYDAFIIDCIWFCHSKRFIIKGTEDMIDEYHNYKFHILGSLKGMIIGIPICLLTGLIIQIL